MNILWLTNLALPEASLLMNEKSLPFGGWFVSASDYLANEKGIELSVAFPKIGLYDVHIYKGKKIKYYSFPSIGKKNTESNRSNLHINNILDQVKPDIVHIFGTEYAHTLAMVNACNERNITVVISVQGLTSIVAKHYLAGLPSKVQSRFTFRDLLKRDNLKQQQRKFAKRGRLEIEALQKVKHIIGRTTWDRACTFQINPGAEYYFCNETLRGEFYKHQWDINRCERHSIFVSQGSYPIKGLHFMLEAMPLILERFPNTRLYVAGHNITKSDALKDRLKRSSYGKYIEELIHRFNLKNNVLFTGILDEKQMCDRFLKSHVFVSPSIVENESNSLSEAKIMGIPCVASYVGGVTDRIEHNIDGFFYQADAPYMLAHYVCEIFSNDELAIKFSEKASEHAMHTHDENTNNTTLIRIYSELAE